MKRLNEGTAFTATVRSRDEDNLATIPTTFRYRIDCVTTGSEVLGWTSATPAAEIDLAITAGQVDIIDRTNEVERKKITVQADAGLSTANTGEFPFEVKRLEGF